MSKSEIRSHITHTLQQVPQSLLADRSRTIASRLFDLPLWVNSRTVLVYMSLSDEVDTRPIITAALLEGKRVFVPRVTGEILAFHAVDSLDDISVPHAYGMLEPRSDRPQFPETMPPDGPGLVLVPGRAFDPQKHRLGRGKGFYDRFLRGLDKDHEPDRFSILGLCFQLQLLPAVPHDDNDVRMHGVLTEEEMII
jgi:5-formyltetrahydrofolate cyclo-ligase